jgi:hypothetical protein
MSAKDYMLNPLVMWAAHWGSRGLTRVHLFLPGANTSECKRAVRTNSKPMTLNLIHTYWPLPCLRCREVAQSLNIPTN